MKTQMQPEVKERPILFSGEMVRAILDGRKTQTRRVLKPQPVGYPEFYTLAISFGRGLFPKGGEISGCLGHFYPPTLELYDLDVLRSQGGLAWQSGVPTQKWTCPYGKPGDRLWVRESFLRWKSPHLGNCADYLYLGDPEAQAAIDEIPRLKEIARKCGGASGCWVKTPSIHMPRWVSRITLEITNARVERLQDISEEDAEAEGVMRIPLHNNDVYGETHREAFERLWDKINGKKHPWASNPFVWVIEFQKLDA